MSKRTGLMPLFLCAAAWCVQNTAPKEESASDFTISTDVDLVILDVSVKDTKGGYRSGLTQEDFRIYENGKLQPIKHFSHADIPVTAGLVVDNSGSMRPKRQEVVTAALTFVRASNPQDEMFVINFNDSVRPGLPKGMLFADDSEVLRKALWNGASEGRTMLYDALAYSLQHLEKGRMGKKSLVVVSDGGDNASTLKFAELMRRVEGSLATIYTIGIFDETDPDRNPDVLRKLAQVSGGEYFQLAELSEIVPVCKKIAGDIRNRYTMAYVPPRGDAKKLERQIKVTASSSTGGRLIVHTRKRYISPERTADRGTQR